MPALALGEGRLSHASPMGGPDGGGRVYPMQGRARAPAAWGQKGPGIARPKRRSAPGEMHSDDAMLSRALGLAAVDTRPVTAARGN